MVQEEAYSQMLDENWDLAETLYGFLKDEKDLQADEELMFTVNHWQCMKWNNKYEDISAEIEGADFSAYCLRFQVALAALRSDKESFFQLLDQAVPHEIPIDAALEWPLFREMRGFPEFDAFAAKHGIGPEAEEEEDHESQEAQFDRVSLA